MGTDRPRRARDRPCARLDTEPVVPHFFAMASSRPERPSQANFRVGGHRAAGPFCPEADAEGTKKVTGRERMADADRAQGHRELVGGCGKGRPHGIRAERIPSSAEAVIARLVAARTGGCGKRGSGMLVGRPLETGICAVCDGKIVAIRTSNGACTRVRVFAGVPMAGRDGVAIEAADPSAAAEGRPARKPGAWQSRQNGSGSSA